uniref:Transcription factor phomR n=1 Tax=Diaporthe leptostromiformis TaxID=291059 RepID=PHOR1_DIALO|nr:RecName: Full=Transcription factor phomR; AltName: Full=Phomopsin biosynthesis cluster protein R [Diaporthe leptostromiformis]BDA39143.1 transcriptional regulator [Diaporthe leptostromiformis]
MTTSTAAKRTKSGCWTCRLRRKKCNEGGPPCDNCEARGIHCHGYGPRPQWKDRGALEREEARKLQYQSGRGRSYSRSSSTAAAAAPKPAEGAMVTGGSSSSSRGSGSSIYVGGNGLGGAQEEQHGDNNAPFSAGTGNFEYQANPAPGISPLMSDIDLALDAHAMDPLDFNFDFSSTPSSAVDKSSSTSADSPSFTSIECSQFPIFSPELTVDTPVALFPQVAPIPPGLPGRESVPVAACTDLVISHGLLLEEMDRPVGQRHGQVMAEGEKGIELMMRCPPAPRAPRLEGQGRSAHILLFVRDWYAASSWRIWSGNIQDCQNHIDAAASLLLEHETALVGEAHRLSNMERKALAFFTVRLIWNDVLLSSTRRTVPKAEMVYRRLLLADSNSRGGDSHTTTSTTGPTTTTPLLAASTFWDLTGCEGAVLLAMLDASILSAWRLGEEASGSLSIRALVGRADKIEAVVEGEIARLSSLLPRSPEKTSSASGKPSHGRKTGPENEVTVATVHSLIFAHAILTDLHQTVSGPRASVPEIGDSISRAISSAWNLWQEQQQQGAGLGLERILAWPYCVAASLAKGDQREVFREIIARTENGDGSSSGGDVQQLKSIVEQCWATSSSNHRDWKDVVQRSNQFGVFLI